jgi:hypothetical protein
MAATFIFAVHFSAVCSQLSWWGQYFSILINFIDSPEKKKRKGASGHR